MECRNHPGTAASDRCAGCMEPFCPNCLVTVKGRPYCASCKVMAIGDKTPVFEQLTEECVEAKEALKLALIGLFCFGVVLGPMAIKKANEAKKMIAANPNLTGSGKATAALVIGIIDFVGWLVSIVARISSH